MAVTTAQGWSYTDVTVASAAGSGNTTSEPMSGRLYQVEYIKDASAPYSANATFTVHAIRGGGSTLVLLFTSVATQIDNDNWFAFGSPILDNAGAASTGVECYAGVNDTFKVSVASAGSSKTGVFRLKFKP